MRAGRTGGSQRRLRRRGRRAALAQGPGPREHGARLGGHGGGHGDGRTRPRRASSRGNSQHAVRGSVRNSRRRRRAAGRDHADLAERQPARPRRGAHDGRYGAGHPRPRQLRPDRRRRRPPAAGLDDHRQGRAAPPRPAASRPRADSRAACAAPRTGSRCAERWSSSPTPGARCWPPGRTGEQGDFRFDELVARHLHARGQRAGPPSRRPAGRGRESGHQPCRRRTARGRPRAGRHPRRPRHAARCRTRA